MDSAHHVLSSFKLSALKDSTGVVLDINATVSDVDTYSAVNSRNITVIATSHSQDTTRRIESLKPTRPEVCTVTVDLQAPYGLYWLQCHLQNTELSAVFWRLESVNDLTRTIALLSTRMRSDAILYIYAVHREMARELILCEEAYESNGVLHIANCKRQMPQFDIDDVHDACVHAGLQHIFDENLDDTADRIGVNILPICRRICKAHKVRAYQVGVHL